MNRTVARAAACSIAMVTWASACKVINPGHSITRKAADAAATYHGVLVRSGLGQACGTPARLLTLRVSKAFGASAMKGDTVVIATAQESSVCGVDYPAGTILVIFASRMRECASAGPDQWTSQASFNEVGPTQAQLDSLYGGPATLARLGNKDMRTSLNGGTLGFRLPEAGACRLDGRSLDP